MILTFLRELRKNNPSEQLKSYLLSDYLLEFLNFYGNVFDYSGKTIIMNDSGDIVPKDSREFIDNLLINLIC